MTLKPVAHIENDFSTKFGLPRQSGLNPALKSRVVLEKGYGADYIRGIEEYSHLWLLWRFDVPSGDKATVRPPRLGGNERKGVFATRSPFRPNPLGLTVVRLEGTEITDSGVILTVSGADLMNGTVIYDLKPYIPYADCVPDARGSFAEEHRNDRVRVMFPPELLEMIPSDKQNALTEALAEDPRPAYQDDPDRTYGFVYAGRDVRFSVRDGVLTVKEIKEL